MTATVSVRRERHAVRSAARRGTVLVLVSATGFGMSAVFAKQAYAAGFNVPTMLAGRFALAAVLLWARGRLAAPAVAARRALASASGSGGRLRPAGRALLRGAGPRSTPSLTALLLYAYPALVTVLAILLRRERPDRRRLAALACSAAGMLLMLGTAGSVARPPPGGVLLALGAAVAYALYLTVSAGLPAGSTCSR